MQCFLNELSLPHFHSRAEGIKVFEDFVKVYKTARSNGVRDIKIHSSFFSHEFAPNWTFLNWIEEKGVDQDSIILLKGVMTSIPFVDQILDQYQTEHQPVYMTLEGNAVIGIGLASDYAFNTIAFSYNSEAWNLDMYHPTIQEIFEDADGNVIDQTIVAACKHISIQWHSETHEDFIQNTAASEIESGKELWLKREDLFPNLVFCESVRGQIAGYNANTAGFAIIISRLFDLQKVASALNGNPVKPEDFPTSTTPESTTREQNYPEDFKFLCPDGEYGFFTWHSRFTPGAGRIHFIAEEDKNSIIVGYIGQKIRA